MFLPQRNPDPMIMGLIRISKVADFIAISAANPGAEVSPPARKRDNTNALNIFREHNSVGSSCCADMWFLSRRACPMAPGLPDTNSGRPTRSLTSTKLKACRSSAQT